MVTDGFALLGLERRPWVDPASLKDKFLALSSEAHPDRFHQAPSADREAAAERSAALNTAYQCLRESRSRLLHLIELETGARPPDIQRIPPGTMELFAEIGQACREADAFLAERRAVSSPMLRVRLFQQGLEWTERLKGLQGRVRQRGEALEANLRDLNSAWEMAPAVGHAGRAAALPLAQLEETYRALSFVSRWLGQIEERLVQLAAP